MRAVKIIRNILAVLGLVWLCMPIFREAKKVVALSFPWVWQEKGRVPTPSGACEVVTYEGNRGGMSSFAYVCFLVKPGGKVDPNAVDFYEPILATSHAQPKPRWENDNRLIISCEGGYVGHQRPYSRDFKVAIEVRGAEMSRYQVSLCEHATGIVRDADSPETRYNAANGGKQSRFFDTEDDALRFKDDILTRFTDLEAAVRPEATPSGGLRFYREASHVVCEVISDK